MVCKALSQSDVKLFRNLMIYVLTYSHPGRHKLITNLTFCQLSHKTSTAPAKHQSHHKSHSPCATNRSGTRKEHNPQNVI